MSDLQEDSTVKSADVLPKQNQPNKQTNKRTDEKGAEKGNFPFEKKPAKALRAKSDKFPGRLGRWQDNRSQLKGCEWYSTRPDYWTSK
jgi:hypothetical protein